MTSTLFECAHRILTGRALEEKWAVLAPGDVGVPLPAVPPSRTSELTPVHGHDKLPKLNTLDDAKARALCLHRFANHELQAIELFAWAILKFHAMPESFLRGLWAILVEEQKHLRAYVDRLGTYGMRFGDVPVSGNFWDQAPLMETPLHFVCAMGLTFENANLDFAVLYRDAFRRFGAEEDARVMEMVHHDELGHVAWGLSWLRRLKRDDESDLEAYLRSTPFPLGLHRAKGRNFSASVRRKAGLDDAFISAIRDARAPMETASKK